jgi:hypothetical protein
MNGPSEVARGALLANDLPQDFPRLLLHGSTMFGGAQAQATLYIVVKIADRYAGDGILRSQGSGCAVIALQSRQGCALDHARFERNLLQARETRQARRRFNRRATLLTCIWRRVDEPDQHAIREHLASFPVTVRTFPGSKAQPSSG